MHQLEGVIRLDGGIPRQTDGRQPMDDNRWTTTDGRQDFDFPRESAEDGTR